MAFSEFNMLESDIANIPDGKDTASFANMIGFPKATPETRPFIDHARNLARRFWSDGHYNADSTIHVAIV